MLQKFKNIRGIHEQNYSVSPGASMSGYIYLGEYAIIESGASICNALIGRMAHIGSRVIIGKTALPEKLILNHPFAYRNHERFFSSQEITKIRKSKYFFENNPMTEIGHDSHIHDQSFIRAGVSIGRGSIIYPNSVVVGDVPPYSIVAGNPATIIGKRFSEETCLMLDEICPESLSFDSLLWRDRDVNFGDLSKLHSYRGSQRIIKTFKFSSSRSDEELKSKKLVVGPSHITRWLGYCSTGKLEWPRFEMWGVSGLSLASESLHNVIRFWLSLDSDREVILMVPDFRIGNTALISKEKNPLFIYRNAMGIPNADDELKYQHFKILDKLVHEFKNRIKFIFWCQCGRERTNIRNGRYVDEKTGEYVHIMTTKELYNRYPINTIKIPEIENYFSLIEPDGSIHPTLEGYKFIETIIDGLK